MMTPYETFVTYLAIKAHFNSSYDYFKYHGKIKSSIDQFQNRKDKYYFQKISNKQQDPVMFFAANFAHNKDFWIGETQTTKPLQIYNQQQKVLKNTRYLFEQLFDSLYSKYGNTFLKVENNQHPIAFQLFLSEQLYLELLIVLLDVTNMQDYWSNQMPDDVSWKHTNLVISKYRPFLKYDKDALKEIAKKVIRSS